MNAVRDWLRRETAALHDAVDREVEQIDASTAKGARALCRYLHRGNLTVEAALERANVHRILPEWPSRKCAGLLGDRAPTLDGQGPHALEFQGESEVWGALYVMEGSRLGSKFLARRYAPLAKHPYFIAALADRFWPIFLARLGEAHATLEKKDALLSGARRAFGAFRSTHGGERMDASFIQPAMAIAASPAPSSASGEAA